MTTGTKSLRVVHRRNLNLAVDRPRDFLFDTLPVEIPEHDFPLEPCVSLQDPSRRRELRAEFRTNGETLFYLKIKNVSNININTYRNMFFSPKRRNI
jgi:hypothetical protein